MTLTLNEIKILQSLPLDIKIKKTKLRIQEFYRYFGGDVCVAFSGGKDSTVLLHLVRSIYPDVPAVFNDTGLEYPEVREFVKTIDNVVTLKPEMGFKKVIETYGYPVVSKNVAMQLRFLQNRCPKNEKTCVAYLTGIKQDGTPFKGHKLAPKWHYLIDAPFKISEQCCNIMKKNPSYKYYKENGLHPYVGTMAENSEQRKMVFMRIGCNNFTGNMQSKPLSPWMEKDIWNYINQEKLPYSKIYDMGYKNTGCMFCMFGVHMRKTNEFNRFQRMQHTHPKQYSYCMNQLGLKEILKYMDIPYEGMPIKLSEFL